MSTTSRAVTICGAVVALVLTSDNGSAQTTLAAHRPRLDLGSHVRIAGQRTHSAVFSGRLRAMSNDSITLALDDDSTTEVPYAIADIGHLEVEQDERTREQATAVMGVIGAAGGLTAAVFWCRNNHADCADDIQKMREAAQGDSTYYGPTLLMILGGALLGSGLGYVLAPPPHWELVAFPTRTSTNNGSPRLLLNVGLRYSLGGRQRH